MSIPPAPPSAAGAASLAAGAGSPPARTRLRFALMSAVLVLASTVCAALLVLLAERYAVAIDVTATREQELSPRTAKLLASLTGDYEIVIAADWTRLDPRAARRARDVLDLLRRGSRHVSASVIDTSSAAGAASYERLLARLAERDAPKARAHGDAIFAAIAGAQGLGASMQSLSSRFLAIRDAIPTGGAGAETNRQFFDDQAAQFRVNGSTLGEIAAKSRESLEKEPGPLGVPDFDAAAAPLKKAMTDLDAGLRQVLSSVDLVARAEEMPEAVRTLAAPLARDLSGLRDLAAIQADALARLPRLDTARVAGVLESSEAALVIGPPEAGVTAVPFEWLFPAGEALATGGGSHADVRRRNEELFATAIDSLARPVNPIVVVVHSWPPPPLLDRQRGFGALVERLGLRGIDVVEWAAAVQPEPPSLRSLDLKGNRPVVYAVFNSDAGASSAEGGNGPERAQRLGATLARLVEDGRAILLSVIPSPLPAFGSKDPLVSALPLFGLSADSARPLMRDALTPSGRVVLPDFQLIASGEGHSVAAAVRGLRTLFEWPVPLRVLPESEAGRSRVTPLYVLEDRGAWAEAEWQELWAVAAPGVRRGLARASPTADAARDDVSGRWVVAAASERDRPAGAGVQRLVAVSSNTWFTDRVTTQQSRLVDGRIASANPGNIELFEAAVYWLAGQDDRIGASATARAVPVIRPLGEGTLAALRWMLVLGLPVLTLGAGVWWRWWRG